MKLIATTSVTALLVLAACTPASAHWSGCRDGVAAVGRMANGLNFDPPRHYDTERLAAEVALRCPGRSTFWWRAYDKRVDCEGYAGGVACRVRAAPARKLLSFGFPD